MSEWIVSDDCPGYRTKTIQHGSCTITICRPILDTAEQAKREKQTQAALERGLRDYILRKEQRA